MAKKRIRCMSVIILLILLAVMAFPIPQLWAAHADEIVTPSDLTTPAPSAEPTSAPTPEPTAPPTEMPKTGKRSGYAVLRSGAKVWTTRNRTSSVGTVTADSYVWIPNTTVNSLTYKIRFDTELSVWLDDCHTYYVLSSDVRWLSDGECAELEKKLEEQEARSSGGVLIPVIAFNYSKPPATPKTTPTPVVTPSPEPTPSPTATPTAEPVVTPLVTPAPEPTPSPTATPTAEPVVTPLVTPAPEPTSPAEAVPSDPPTQRPTAAPTVSAVPDITTDTDLTTPAPTAAPAVSVTPDITTDTDLIPPEPTAVPSVPVTPDITTDTDLNAPALMTAEEMQAELDRTNPQRQVSLWVTCTDPYYSNGSRMTLWANISGYEGLAFEVIWEVDRGDGQGYVNAGINGLKSLSFIIDDENVHWRWRAAVSMPYMEKE